MDDKLLALLARELGEILSWEEKCPGVYYLNLQRRNNLALEYYLVLETAPISCDARKLGRRLEDVPAWTYLDPHPRLLVDGYGIRAGESFRARFPDGWHDITLEVAWEITGPGCWYISTPGYEGVCPVGLFVKD